MCHICVPLECTRTISNTVQPNLDEVRGLLGSMMKLLSMSEIKLLSMSEMKSCLRTCQSISEGEEQGL